MNQDLMVFFQEITYQKIFKERAYIINLDHSKNTGTHLVVLFSKKDEVIYFDRFGVEFLPREIKKFKDENIKTNIFRIQDYDSIMCGYFCILFIEFMLKGKTLNI